MRFFSDIHSANLVLLQCVTLTQCKGLQLLWTIKILTLRILHTELPTIANCNSDFPSPTLVLREVSVLVGYDSLYSSSSLSDLGGNSLPLLGI